MRKIQQAITIFASIFFVGTLLILVGIFVSAILALLGGRANSSTMFTFGVGATVFLVLAFLSYKLWMRSKLVFEQRLDSDDVSSPRHYPPRKLLSPRDRRNMERLERGE